MKLYSDEESDYICRDSRAVPLALRDQVFNLIMDDNHVSLFNPLGYQKRTYHTPTNVNLYSEAVSLQMGIEPAGFINEYNKRYDVWYKAMQDRELRDQAQPVNLGPNYGGPTLMSSSENDMDRTSPSKPTKPSRGARGRPLPPDPPRVNSPRKGRPPTTPKALAKQTKALQAAQEKYQKKQDIYQSGGVNTEEAPSLS